MIGVFSYCDQTKIMEEKIIYIGRDNFLTDHISCRGDAIYLLSQTGAPTSCKWRFVYVVSVVENGRISLLIFPLSNIKSKAIGVLLFWWYYEVQACQLILKKRKVSIFTQGNTGKKSLRVIGQGHVLGLQQGGDISFKLTVMNLIN